VVVLPCEARWELEEFWLCVCMAPLWLGGLRGKKSTPSIGWEVSVKSPWLESGVMDGVQERENIFEFSSSVTVLMLRL
jgi:hypothetical protein